MTAVLRVLTGQRSGLRPRPTVPPTGLWARALTIRNCTFGTIVIGLMLAAVTGAAPGSEHSPASSTMTRGTSNVSVLAHCKWCQCGGPHAHPEVTNTIVILQCAMPCDDQMRLSLYCDTLDQNPLLNGFLGPHEQL